MRDLTSLPGISSEIRKLVRDQRQSEARRLVVALIEAVTPLAVSDVSIATDQYSLNSVHGFVRSTAGAEYFFKFHQEEGEETSVGEYYNAQVLKDAGYSVQEPVFSETSPGRQILLYERITDPRLADVCSAIDKGEFEVRPADVVAVQERTDRKFADIAVGTLHMADSKTAANQPLFQLFYNRLIDHPDTRIPRRLGGRVASFYLGQRVNWPGLSEPFEELWTCRWRINGIDYPTTLKTCFKRCLEGLSPGCFFPGPAVTAHGDAHNANVWFHPAKDDRDGHLSLFDPAFAGAHVPALLATFLPSS